MKHMLSGLALVAALIVAPLAQSQDQDKEKPKPPDAAQSTPLEKLRDLLKEFQQAQQAFGEVYSKAKTDEERQKVFEEKYPNTEKFAERFLKLAQDHPKDTAAIDALVWVATFAGFGPSGEKALQVLARDHVASVKMAEICPQLGYLPGAEGPKLLRKLIAESPHAEVKGQATMALAQSLLRGNSGDEAKTKEAEALFEEVIAKFATVKSFRSTLGEAAKSELFAMRNLAVGKAAPEITGEDIDGRPMKLSEFRGKVVVLDFWGHW